MTAHLTLKPDQNDSKYLVDQYGDRLLYIRYRYDAEKRKRCKTVEIIVEEATWEPANGIDAVPLCDQTEIPVQIEIQHQPDKLPAPNILSNP